MERSGRLVVAGLVTVATFAVVTWVCGAFVLPSMLDSGADRWVVASALGVALAGLAALWGHGFATGTEAKPSPPPTPSVSVNVPGAGAVGVGRDSRAPITTAGGQAAAVPPVTPPPVPQEQPTAPGATNVSAAGDGAIAIGRDSFGQLSTDGRPTEQRP